MRRSGKTGKVLLDDGWKMGKVMLGVGSGDENWRGNEMRNVMRKKRTMMNVRSQRKKKK